MNFAERIIRELAESFGIIQQEDPMQKKMGIRTIRPDELKQCLEVYGDAALTREQLTEVLSFLRWPRELVLATYAELKEKPGIQNFYIEAESAEGRSRRVDVFGHIIQDGEFVCRFIQPEGHMFVFNDKGAAERHLRPSAVLKRLERMDTHLKLSKKLRGIGVSIAPQVPGEESFYIPREKLEEAYPIIKAYLDHIQPRSARIIYTESSVNFHKALTPEEAYGVGKHLGDGVQYSPKDSETVMSFNKAWNDRKLPPQKEYVDHVRGEWDHDPNRVLPQEVKKGVVQEGCRAPSEDLPILINPVDQVWIEMERRCTNISVMSKDSEEKPVLQVLLFKDVSESKCLELFNHLVRIRDSHGDVFRSRWFVSKSLKDYGTSSRTYFTTGKPDDLGVLFLKDLDGAHKRSLPRGAGYSITLVKSGLGRSHHCCTFHTRSDDLSCKDALRFYGLANSLLDSYLDVNLRGTRAYLEAEVQYLAQECRRKGTLTVTST